LIEHTLTVLSKIHNEFTIWNLFLRINSLRRLLILRNFWFFIFIKYI